MTYSSEQCARFIKWTLVLLLTLLSAIFAILYYIDPTGVTGRTTKYQITDTGKDRTTKISLLRSYPEPIEILVVGSSRSMKIDPKTIKTLTGKEAFNAAVSGGVPKDSYLLYRYFLDTRKDSQDAHIVWGLDLDSFRNKQLNDGVHKDPRMRKYIDEEPLIKEWISTTQSLLTMQVVEAAYKALTVGKKTVKNDRAFAKNGFQEWSLPLPQNQRAQTNAINKQMQQYEQFIFERDGFTTLQDKPIQYFVQTIRLANKHGDTPDVFLTPYHPTAWKRMQKYHVNKIQQQLLQALVDIQRRHNIEFTIHDTSSLKAFNGSPTQFYDGIHMTKENTDKLISYVLS